MIIVILSANVYNIKHPSIHIRIVNSRDVNMHTY